MIRQWCGFFTHYPVERLDCASSN